AAVVHSPELHQTAVAGRPESQVAPDPRDELGEPLTETVEHHISVLHTSLQNKLYGIASVHISAMRPLLKKLNSSDTNSHYVVLCALVESLNRMECEFEFDSKIDPALKEMLETEAFYGDVNDPA